MQETLRRMREKRADGDRGFTLIELLVVVVIIGVLVGIAIPVYMNYTKGAENKAVQSDVRNAVAAVEQCYTDGGNTYPANGGSAATGDPSFVLTCGTGAGAPTVKVTVSDSVKLTYTATATTYTIVGVGKNATYTYDSSTGKTAKTA